MTAEYAALITAATDWLENAYCTRKDEYRKREKTLREAFGEMYTTRILEDPAVAQGRAPSAHGGHRASTVGGNPGTAAGAKRAGSPSQGVSAAQAFLAETLSTRSRSPSPTGSPQTLSRKILPM
jgi:hypothetical protein